MGGGLDYFRLLPLGRRILLLVVAVSLISALFLQVAGMLVVRSHLDASHTRAARKQAELIAFELDDALRHGQQGRVAEVLSDSKVRDDELRYLIFCDAQGHILQAETDAILSEDFKSWLRAHSKPSGPESFTLRTEKGDILHLVQPLSENDLAYVHLGISWAPVDAAVRDVCLSLLLAVVVSLLVSSVVAWHSFSRLAQPVVDLIEFVKAFGRGRLSARVKCSDSHSEAKLLGHAFNEMADQLERQVADLVQSHEDLSLEKARIQAILDSVDFAIVVAERDGAIIYANRFAQSRGASSATGNTYQQLRATRQSLLNAFKEVASGEVLQRGIQERASGKDLDITIVAVKRANGESLGILEITHDVTHQLQSWRALAHADKLNIVGQLTAVVAHEINSPLDGALEASRIIEKDAADTQKVRQFAVAQRSGLERIAVFVRRLLTFSRMPSGQERTLVCVSRLLDETQALIHHRLSKVKVEIEPEDLSRFVVKADEFGLVQILVNLLNNAVDASPPGGLVRIQVARQNGALTISVADQGPGVSPEAEARVFKSFYTSKTAGKGTGLGLMVSRDIAAEHGGKLQFENLEPPWGACFTLTLPCENTKPARQEQVAHLAGELAD